MIGRTTTTLHKYILHEYNVLVHRLLVSPRMVTPFDSPVHSKFRFVRAVGIGIGMQWVYAELSV